MYVWDETKRKSNLEKHGLDFKEAWMADENPDKSTYDTSWPGEHRRMDIALAEIHGRVLTLIYTERGEDVRIISFRRASRQELDLYEKDQE